MSSPKPGEKPDFAEQAAAVLSVLQPMHRPLGRLGGPLTEGAKSVSCDSDSDSMAAYEVRWPLHDIVITNIVWCMHTHGCSGGGAYTAQKVVQ